MDLPFRKVVKLGPLQLTYGRRRLAGWSVKLGRWSWGNRSKVLSRLGG